MNQIHRVAVYCGSSSGSDPSFPKLAYELGKELTNNRIGIVYGGASIGLMGQVANGALDNGGFVIGVLPKFLKIKEIEHTNLSEIHIVDTMQERKMKMYELADAFIALPGGFGTMEELFEILTWGQLGLHTKPIGLMNWNSFYNPLISQLKQMVDQGFLKSSHFNLLKIQNDIESMLECFLNYSPTNLGGFLTEDKI
jgi:uncharacterized protein (TIGR00730 family)